MLFLWSFPNGIRWRKYACLWKTPNSTPKWKLCSGQKSMKPSIRPGNFPASTFKLPILWLSWINTAFGKVKPVRSSSESPWVNYNMWWWHSCVFWNQPGEVRVGHYKPLAFTTGCKRQWGQEASHRDQGAQSPAKNKQAPIVTSAGKYIGAWIPRCQSNGKRMPRYSRLPRDHRIIMTGIGTDRSSC